MEEDMQKKRRIFLLGFSLLTFIKTTQAAILISQQDFFNFYTGNSAWIDFILYSGILIFIALNFFENKFGKENRGATVAGIILGLALSLGLTIWEIKAGYNIGDIWWIVLIILAAFLLTSIIKWFKELRSEGEGKGNILWILLILLGIFFLILLFFPWLVDRIPFKGDIIWILMTILLLALLIYLLRWLFKKDWWDKRRKARRDAAEEETTGEETKISRRDERPQQETTERRIPPYEERPRVSDQLNVFIRAVGLKRKKVKKTKREYQIRDDDTIELIAEISGGSEDPRRYFCQWKINNEIKQEGRASDWKNRINIQASDYIKEKENKKKIQVELLVLDEGKRINPVKIELEIKITRRLFLFRGIWKTIKEGTQEAAEGTGDWFIKKARQIGKGIWVYIRKTIKSGGGKKGEPLEVSIILQPDNSRIEFYEGEIIRAQPFAQGGSGNPENYIFEWRIHGIPLEKPTTADEECEIGTSAYLKDNEEKKEILLDVVVRDKEVRATPAEAIRTIRIVRKKWDSTGASGTYTYDKGPTWRVEETKKEKRVVITKPVNKGEVINLKERTEITFECETFNQEKKESIIWYKIKLRGPGKRRITKENLEARGEVLGKGKIYIKNINSGFPVDFEREETYAVVAVLTKRKRGLLYITGMINQENTIYLKVIKEEQEAQFKPEIVRGKEKDITIERIEEVEDKDILAIEEDIEEREEDLKKVKEYVQGLYNKFEDRKYVKWCEVTSKDPKRIENAEQYLYQRGLRVDKETQREIARVFLEDLTPETFKIRKNNEAIQRILETYLASYQYTCQQYSMNPLELESAINFIISIKEDAGLKGDTKELARMLLNLYSKKRV